MNNIIRESELENKLIEHLINFDHYKFNNKIKTTDQLVDYIVDEAVRRNPDSFDHDLLSNQRQDLRHHLLEGDVFTKAKFLRDGYQFPSKTNIPLPSIKFIDFDDYSNNNFEVINQLNTYDNGVKNRFDVVLLVNGFPLVHIELKRQGVDVSEAIHQLGRYKRQSREDSVMDYTQFYIVSNQITTFYIANQNKQLNKEFAIKWTDEKNKGIFNLLPQENTTRCVVNELLDRKNLIEILHNFFLLDEETRSLIILRPYQIYAVKSIINKVNNYKPCDDYRTNSGYIYHATGSGKTLTSFTAAKLIAKNHEVKKVIFVVDRIDLAEQTKKEYNRYGKGVFEVPSIHHTGQLIDALNDNSAKIVVTTVQKLANAIGRFKEDSSLDRNDLSNNRVVVIFDEGHRSVAGKMGSDITKYFHQLQMFGFTGTPIFAEQSDAKTHYNQTKDQFGEQLAEYNIKDAIKDKSILEFKVQYYDFVDPKYSELEKSEIRKNDVFINEMAHHILDTIYDMTDRGRFNAMVAVDSVQSAQKLYEKIGEILQEYRFEIDDSDFDKKQYYDNFKYAVVFSIAANNEDESELSDNTIRDWYNKAIVQFSEQYNHTDDALTINVHNQDAKKIYALEVANRVKSNKVNLLIVCSMFLTGFDAKCINTLYLDKDQQDHNLIQSFARTNRKADASKVYGNILFYLGDQDVVNRALDTYSGSGYYDVVKPYEEIINEYQELAQAFIQTYGEDTNKIQSSDDVEFLENFLRDFRRILRLNKLIHSYKEFKEEEQPLDEMFIRNMSSVYQNVYRRLQRKEEQDKDYSLDFDPLLELVELNVIDLSYINKLHNEKNEYSIDQIETMINKIAGDEYVHHILKEYVLNTEINDCGDFIQNKMNQDIKTLAHEYEFEPEVLINIVHTQYVKPPLTQIRDYLQRQGYGLTKRVQLAKEINGKLSDILFKYEQFRGIND